MPFDTVGDVMMALGLTLPRIAGAFLMLPLLTAETVPAMVRNSFMVSLAIVALPISMAGIPVDALNALQWVPVVLKELFIGISIGFCFGIVFWAIGAVGNVLDTQVGLGMAAVFDPIQGHQTSVHGDFLSRAAMWLFMASGAFLVFLDLLLSSYSLWPVTQWWPTLHAQGMELFVGHFSYMMTAVLVMAAPAMVLLLIVDLSFGLVNRYAPQLNVFALTLPIKAWIATAVILLLLGVYAEILLDRLDTNRGLLQLMQKAFT
jgi:type III secretion protein T